MGPCHCCLLVYVSPDMTGLPVAEPYVEAQVSMSGGQCLRERGKIHDHILAVGVGT